MTTLMLELAPELYERLRQKAERDGESVEDTVRELLIERLALSAEPTTKSEREVAREALRAAGLLAELSPEEKKRAARSTATLEEVRIALDKVGGKPLSELILEMRGSKE
jgi:hypothetical protein